jgi:hypothetical protein
MAKLGEAYIAVRADLRPFDKDLQRSLKSITDRFEKDLNKEFGRKIGTNVGTGAREGLRDSTKGIGRDLSAELESTSVAAGLRAGRKAKQGFGRGFERDDSHLGPIRKFLSGMVSALEDGFSALPSEVKAVVGAALVAAIVPAGAFIAGAIGGAVIAGFAGIGTALAFQFEEVEARGKTFADNLRNQFVDAASSFIGPLDFAFDLFEGRLAALDPKIESLFANAAHYVAPLAEAGTRFVEGFVTGLDEGFKKADLQGISNSLIRGFDNLGDSIGDALGTILANPNLAEGLEDLLDTVSDLTYLGGQLLDWTLNQWHAFKQLASGVGDFVEGFVDGVALINDFISLDFDTGADRWRRLTGEVHMTSKSFKAIGPDFDSIKYNLDGTIKLTDEQAKKLKEMNRQLEAQYDAIRDVISTNVDYHRSLNDTIEGFKKVGTSLAENTKVGQDNRKNILDTITDLQAQTNARIESGEVSNAAGQKFYDQEIARLRNEFTKRGGNIRQFDEIFAKFIKLQGLAQVPDKMGLLNWALDRTKGLLDGVLEGLNKVSKAPKASVGGRNLPQFADGGFVTQPTIAAIGEGYRKELVLPLTRPDRSMQLLAKSGLNLSSGTTVVYAYFDGEPFQARIVRTATAATRGAARTLSQAPRTVI